jgi:kynurenine formamidase
MVYLHSVAMILTLPTNRLVVSEERANVKTQSDRSVTAMRPRYDDLPRIAGLGLPHAWDVLDHELGTLSGMTGKRVRAAAELVADGTTIGLNLPVDVPDPPLFGREPVRHDIFAVDRNTLDDRLDAFHPQSSSQWDGLRHVRAREHGFFGGIEQEGLVPGGGPIGIDAWARRGIVGRGVLLDIPGLRRRQGRRYDPLGSETISVEDLQGAAEAQQIALAQGDVLCIRTGWIDAYRALDAGGRAEIAAAPRFSGLSGGEDMARFLWDSGAIAVAADNPALEVGPGDPAVGSLHRRLIPLLGFAVAELLDFEALCEMCAQDGRWDFLFVAVPLNLPGGVGSPANAVAIR